VAAPAVEWPYRRAQAFTLPPDLTARDLPGGLRPRRRRASPRSAR
jgi:hypothetical protein